MMMSKEPKKYWALILGGSSGLGLATAKKLAKANYNILIVHRDRKSDLEEIKRYYQEITLMGAQVKSFNVDVTRADKRAAVLQEIGSLQSTSSGIKVMVHSIAKGSLKPMGGNDGTSLNLQDFQLTLNAMALSMYEWAQDLIKHSLFAEDARIISFTSEGNKKAWEGYAAVSAAKATLEALTRNMALEFAPIGIKVNCIQAGTTDTKAFRMIPKHEELKKNALLRNPNKRLTTPEDVANAVYLLTLEEARWITGTVITVDGGESLR
ncbi:SDR family oxidoreductase [Euzebyella marina]|uniref:SDR family oxidoreductase n=1 Tax=Euzebyella marina TaxID=1761453 RepID=A0A3G2L7D0_9FLAO|nr:SDR family oxidoreductase [Euzebyella marina]AYN68126.1 SDR family oxidoreductase [Euzebyella marina]